LTLLYPGNRKVLAYLRQFEGETVLCVANLSRASQPVELHLGEFRGRVPIELLGRSAFPPIGDLPYFLTLPAYGFYWFLLADEATAPGWHEPSPIFPPEMHTLVLPQGWSSLTAGAAHKVLEERVLPEYLSARRWFAAKDKSSPSIAFAALAEFSFGSESALLGVGDIDIGNGAEIQRYGLPLAIAWEEDIEERPATIAPYVLARVRRASRVGLLYDALASDAFVQEIVAAIRDGRTLECAKGGRLAFAPTRAFPGETDLAALPVQRTLHEQSNTSVRLGDAMVLKMYRRLQGGIHPEIEIGTHLTEVARYDGAPAVLGSVTHVDQAGQPTVLAILSAFVPNQGDGWAVTLDYLRRFFEEADLLAPEALEESGERHKAYLFRVEALGRRVAELHRALGESADDPAFRPEPVTEKDIAAWRSRLRQQERMAHQALQHLRPKMAGESRALAQAVSKAAPALVKRIGAALAAKAGLTKIRCHGDLHLGQVMAVQDDFVIVDFEGEPAHPLNLRRRKHSPVRDIAGMIRSFDYAAASALDERAAIRPESRNTLQPWSNEWRRLAKQAFLAGYRGAIGDCSAFPGEDGPFKTMLDLFVLEKALYEIAYEAANRPDWVHIPLAGVMEVAENGR